MPSRALRSLAAGGIVALCLTPGAWAPDGAANVAVSVSFDRRQVAQGQIAVAEVALANRGPDRAAGLVVEARVTGGRPLRAHATPGRCLRPRGQVFRCVFRTLGYGSGPNVAIQIIAGDGRLPLRVDAVIVGRMTRDPSVGNDRAAATTRVGTRELLANFAEISFVFATPPRVTIGQPFTALLTLLNRGPAPASVGGISVTPTPDARVSLTPLPGRLRFGEERAVRARITPSRVGPLAIRVRVGSTGNAIATVEVDRA